jgi:hypothetical protein
VVVPYTNGGFKDGRGEHGEHLLWEFITFRRESVEACHMCKLGNSLSRHYKEIPAGLNPVKDVPLEIMKHTHVIQEANLSFVLGELAHK